MKDLHLICNAHIDPVWLWDMEEGISAAISTFRMAAVFCEEYDGLVFNHNEVVVYKWIEEMEPELFARIQELVKERKVAYHGRLVSAARLQYARRRILYPADGGRTGIFPGKIRETADNRH